MSSENSVDQQIKNQEILDFNRCAPELDECRLIILKVIEQAVRDYISFEHASSISDMFDYQTAMDFLFNDDYIIDWGGANLSLQDLLDWVNLDKVWVRKRIQIAKKRNIKRFSMKRLMLEKKY